MVPDVTHRQRVIDEGGVRTRWTIGASGGGVEQAVAEYKALLDAVERPGLPRFSAFPMSDGSRILEFACPPGRSISDALAEGSVGHDRRRRWAQRLVRLLGVLQGIRPFALDIGPLSRDRVWIDRSDRLWLMDLGLPPTLRCGAPAAQAQDETLPLLEELVPGESVQQLQALDDIMSSIMRFSAKTTPPAPTASHPEDQEHVRVGQDVLDSFINAIEPMRPSPVPSFLLRQELEEVQGTPDFETLIAPAALGHFEPMPHQLDAAKRALGQMRGRALLADQVGLGKTIEAGLCIKELLLRKELERVLILCPASLARQWQVELYEKFDELFLVMGHDIDTSLAWRCPRLISPFGTVEGRVHADAATSQQYDLVVVDEAHFLNEQRSWRVLQVVRALRKRFFLLLSATPMHNELGELYNIITLLKPGHFPDKDSFVKRYVTEASDHGVKNTSELRSVLAQVMIRNLRSNVEATHPFPKRKATHTPVRPETAALERYKEFSRRYAAAQGASRGRRLHADSAALVESVCSSGEAFRAVLQRNSVWLERRLGGEFVSFLEEFADDFPEGLILPKFEAALAIAAKRVKAGTKVLVFSQFNETAKALHQRAGDVHGLGGRAWLYDEDQAPQEKAAAIRQLRAAPGGGVLFCPAEASEGLNLQFASVMVNYDLPWDPMRIEQRIGRIQRIGGADEVDIQNLFLADTIESTILEVLDKKLRMFEAAVGEVEEVLGQLGEEGDIREIIGHIFAGELIEDEEGNATDPEEHLNAFERKERERAETSEPLAALGQVLLDMEDDDDDDW